MNGPMIAVFPMPPYISDTIVMIVMPGIHPLVNDTICTGNRYYANGFDTLPDYTITGYTIFDTNHFYNYYGIDSIIILQLHVHPVDFILIIDTICAGNHYKANGFDTSTIFTITGYTIFDTNKTINQNGCDSIVFLTLYFLPTVSSIHYNDTIVPNCLK
jgi:hypothetical protein